MLQINYVMNPLVKCGPTSGGTALYFIFTKYNRGKCINYIATLVLGWYKSQHNIIHIQNNAELTI